MWHKQPIIVIRKWIQTKDKMSLENYFMFLFIILNKYCLPWIYLNYDSICVKYE